MISWKHNFVNLPNHKVIRFTNTSASLFTHANHTPRIKTRIVNTIRPQQHNESKHRNSTHPIFTPYTNALHQRTVRIVHKAK